MPVQMLCQRSNEIASAIHDDVLQLLGVCLLEADLCRRFWKRGQSDQVIGELDEILRLLEAAIERSRDIDGALRRIMPRAFAKSEPDASLESGGPIRTRPLLFVVDAAPPPAPVDGPAEILPTLAVCLLQADLSRRLTESGQEQAALRELSMLSQRLEAVVEAYRSIMTQLREPTPLARTA